MKLLIVTQKMDENDDVLGFFISWIKEFARHCEQVEVVCLFEGKHNLPTNVRVHSLGKERGTSKLTQLARFYYFKFFLKYDAVFVHMNPIYVCLAGDWWRLTGKKIVLWYTHKQVDLKLRIAEKLTNFIATAAPESFKLESNKVRVLGHGIEVARFISPPLLPPLTVRGGPGRGYILMVGRITPIKHQDVLIEALKILRDKGINAKVRLVGAAVYESDEHFATQLREKVKEYGLEPYVEFAGSVPNKDVAKEYWQTAVSVNLVPTGGLDKAVLESLAAGTPTLTTNKGFEKLGLGGLAICDLSAEMVADKLAQMLANPPAVDSARIAREFSSAQVVDKILALYK